MVDGGAVGGDAVDEDAAGAGGKWSHVVIADGGGVGGHGTGDGVFRGEFAGAAGVRFVAHGEFLEAAAGAGGVVEDEGADAGVRSADLVPVGDFANENVLHLAQGEGADGVLLVDDDDDAVAADGLGVEAESGGAGEAKFVGIGGAGGGCDVGAALEKGGEAGAGACGDEVDGGAGVLFFEGGDEEGSEFFTEGV